MRISHRQLYESFASHDVRYLVIGGVAAILYGVPRSTIDLDLLIEATPENARALLAALREVGLATAELIDADELISLEIIVFEDILRVDVQTRTAGVRFEEAWDRRRVEDVEGVPVNVLSLDDLIATKVAAGRPIDLEDVALLRAIREERSDSGHPAADGSRP